jgi:beta-phosphoglucomutase
VFTINVCGRDLPKRKPDPGLFLLAAAELKIPPVKCFVVEDSPAGVEAGGRGSMTVAGVARLNDSDLLRAAGADRVVTSLDEIDIDDIAMGRLSRRTA